MNIFCIKSPSHPSFTESLLIPKNLTIYLKSSLAWRNSVLIYCGHFQLFKGFSDQRLVISQNNIYYEAS